MNMGNPSRSLALAETGRKEYLPVDDRAWEEGVSPELRPIFSSSADIFQGSNHERALVRLVPNEYCCFTFHETMSGITFAQSSSHARKR